jgi:hypothetical protein
VYVGNEIVGSGAVADNKVSIDMQKIALFGSGEMTFRIMTEKEGVYYFYEVECLVATKLIKTKQDLLDSVVVKNGSSSAIMGYYILANDIDFEDEVTAAGRTSNVFDFTLGFRGTFDGNGKKISNVQIGSYGFFGQVGKNAVIKNLTFDNVTYLGGEKSIGLFGWSVNTVTISNVTVNVKAYERTTSSSNGDSAGNFVESGLFASRYFQNNVVSNFTINAKGFEIGRLLCRVVSGNTFTNTTIYAKNYLYVADNTDNTSSASFKQLTLDEISGLTFVADEA